MSTVIELLPPHDVECGLTRMHLSNGTRVTIITFVLDADQLARALALPGSDETKIEVLQRRLPPEEFAKITGQIFNILELGILETVLSWSETQGIPVHFYEIVW